MNLIDFLMQPVTLNLRALLGNGGFEQYSFFKQMNERLHEVFTVHLYNAIGQDRQCDAIVQCIRFVSGGSA